MNRMDSEQDLESCQCSEMDPNEQHTCPYREEIDNDSETLCNCCDYCTHQCAMDI